MNASEINQIIASDTKYNYYGIRAMTMNPKNGEFEIAIVGGTVGNSYSWDDGETTDWELNGTSALEVIDGNTEKILEAVKMYDDRSQVVLLGSLYSEYGQDEGEIIMHGNLTVLAII